MKFYQFNGHQAEQPITVFRGAKNLPCTSTTNLRNVAKTARVMRNVKENENVLNEFARVLGNEAWNNRRKAERMRKFGR